MIKFIPIVISSFFIMSTFANAINLEIKGNAYGYKNIEELSYVLEDGLDSVLKEVLSLKSCYHNEYEVHYKKVTEGTWPFNNTYYKYSTSIDVTCPSFLTDIGVEFIRHSDEDYCNYVDFTVTLYDVSSNEREYKSTKYLCDY